jgi:hypothetical protein
MEKIHHHGSIYVMLGVLIHPEVYPFGKGQIYIFNRESLAPPPHPKNCYTTLTVSSTISGCYGPEFIEPDTKKKGT